MLNKKQSARPAESGWLMATALLSLPALKTGIERFGFTLSELEELCRYEAESEMTSRGLKGRLPWRSDVILSAELSKGPEDGADESEWYRLEELRERFIAEMEREDKKRMNKGMDRKSEDGTNNLTTRRTFTSWILPDESRKVIFNESGSESRWSLRNKLKFRSDVFASALSEKTIRLEKHAPKALKDLIETSRSINRKKREGILAEIEEREVEIWKQKSAIKGLRKWLKHVPKKLG
jgi:hypothetical protein